MAIKDPSQGVLLKKKKKRVFAVQASRFFLTLTLFKLISLTFRKSLSTHDANLAEF